MIVERNQTPWVVLVIIVLTGCVISGMLLGNVGPFNSKVVEARIPIQQTQGALSSMSTQDVISIAQTQQAPIVQGTSLAAQMTLDPLQQAATQAAVQSIATQTAAMNYLQNAQILAQATQTTVANELLLQSLERDAAATSIEREQSLQAAGDAAQVALPVMGMLVAAGWLSARTIAMLVKARAQAKAATAKLLAEARRAATQQANIEAQMLKQRNANRSLLMKQQTQHKDLPRAE